MRKTYWAASTVLVVASMFSAVASASASTGKWYVSGKALASGEKATIAETPTILEDFQLGIHSGVGFTTTCASAKVVGGFVEGLQGGTVTKFVFSSCKTVGEHENTCPVKVIETEPLLMKTELGAKSPEAAITFEPASGTTFAKITFGGEECFKSSGWKTLTGKLRTTESTGQSELTEQLLATNSAGELKAATQSATLKGKTKLALGSKGAFGFHE